MQSASSAEALMLSGKLDEFRKIIDQGTHELPRLTSVTTSNLAKRQADFLDHEGFAYFFKGEGSTQREEEWHGAQNLGQKRVEQDYHGSVSILKRNYLRHWVNIELC